MLSIFFFFGRWDRHCVRVTNEVLHEVTFFFFSLSEVLGVKTAFGGNERSQQFPSPPPPLWSSFFWHNMWKHPGCIKLKHTNSTLLFPLRGFDVRLQRNSRCDEMDFNDPQKKSAMSQHSGIRDWISIYYCCLINIAGPLDHAHATVQWLNNGLCY